jgi:enoyl-CoA hydratase
MRTTVKLDIPQVEAPGLPGVSTATGPGGSGSVATITFLPPDARKPPTLDLDVLGELEQALSTIGAAVPRTASPATEYPMRAVVIRSRSEKYFLAGANIEVLKTLDHATFGTWVSRGQTVFRMLEELPLPVIALVGGYALGGGLELALACDLIYATDGSRLGQTETRLGFVSGWGGSFRLSRRIGVSRAKELFFTARMVAAEEAAALGIVDFVGSAADVETHLQDTLRAIGENSPAAVGEMKRLLNGCADASSRAVEAAETESSLDLLRGSDTMARVDAFLNRKK